MNPPDWRTAPYRVNLYTSMTAGLVTVDVDEGTTPAMVTDPVTGDTVRSNMYPAKRPIPDHIPQPTHEWYRPDITPDLSQSEIDHIMKGGLLLRPRTDATPLKHKKGYCN